MSWQGQMGTIVRYLIDDVDPTNYTYSDHRIETTILVAGQLTQMNVDFSKSYDINVENCTLDPDPTVEVEDKAFITLICFEDVSWKCNQLESKCTGHPRWKEFGHCSRRWL